MYRPSSSRLAFGVMLLVLLSCAGVPTAPPQPESHAARAAVGVCAEGQDRECAAARCSVPVHGLPTDNQRRHYSEPDADHGLVQSPVNILSGETVERHHAIAFHYSHDSALFVENRGHTVEIDFPRGSSIDFDGKSYELTQLHFHTPSEHQVDGVTYPMEMHLVNVRAPQPPGSPPEYLVVSVLFRMGAVSTFLTSFMDALPTHDGEHRDLPRGLVYVDELLPPGPAAAYFHYRGSLTTPPFTETVEWLVLKEPLQASPQQIQRLNQLEGDNARHVQALYGRSVER